MRYDLNEVTRLGISSVLATTPYLLIYDLVADSDETVVSLPNVQGDAGHFRLVFNYFNLTQATEKNFKPNFLQVDKEN